MKIARFEILNYKGIRKAEATNLSELPYVVFTGRNGTGKSLIFEVIAAIWAGEINLPDLVGPYANSLSIEIAVQLSSHEYDLLDKWLSETGQDQSERQNEHVVRAIATSTQESGRYAQIDPVIQALQNRHFASRYSFANIDLLSARRQPTLEADIGIDLNLLDTAQSAMNRRQMMHDEIRWKNAQVMPDVGSYLAALDYREYVNSKSSDQISGEYSRLCDTFYRATGKSISRPRFDEHTGRPVITVELPSGVEHGLSDLSNGEREMIGMFYFISQLSSKNGVLLLDEPEKHLHPSLQSAVLEAISSLASEGQAFIVTHSPVIVATVPQDRIGSVKGAWETLQNQLEWASDSEKWFEPLLELGISPRDLLQIEALLIVEGPNDAKRLKVLFPEELARVKIVEAGSREQVLRASEALSRVEVGIPHLCVVDRDYLSDREVMRLEGKGVFVWKARMIENILLNSSLISAVTYKSAAEIAVIIRAAADRFRAEAIGVFAEQRALTLPSEKSFEHSNAVSDYMQRQISIWEMRLNRFEDIRAEVSNEIDSKWKDFYHLYVDGKKVLNVVNGEMRIYRTGEAFIEVLLQASRGSSKVMPKEFLRFRDKLSSLFVVSDVSVSEGHGSVLEGLDEEIRSVIGGLPGENGLNVTDDAMGGGFVC